MSVRILQVNIDRGREATDLLFKTAMTAKVDMILMAEPNKKKVCLGRWLKDKKMDAAILVLNRDIEVLNYEEGHEGFIWVELEGVVIYSCYSSPNITNEQFETYLVSLGESLRTHKKGVLVAGDLNAKSHMWSSRHENERGRMLTDWMAEHSMTIHNVGSDPTFVRRGTESHIDITMSSEGIAAKIKRWRVSDEENLSLHQNIYYTFEAGRPKLQPKTDIKWRVDYRKLPQFIEELKNETTQMCNFEAQECMLAIVRVMDKIFAKQSGNKNRAVYWWNDSIAQVRRECLTARRKMTRANKNNRLTADERETFRNIYKTKRTELRKTIRQAKNYAWQKICEELNDDIWGMAYQIVCKKFKMLPRIKITEEKELDIVRHMFPSQAQQKWPGIESLGDEFPLFSQEELQAAAEKLKNKKSPGPDLIPPEIIKIVISSIPDTILSMMNNHLKQCIFPRIWKRAKLVLVEKPKKPGDLEIKYRTLSLIDCMGKVLEQLIATRLVREVENKLSENQFGFRRKRSTIDAMKCVTKIINEVKEKPFGDRRYAVLVTIDIKNAFNTVPWAGIIKELNEFGVSKYLIKIISSYLEERRLHLTSQQIDMSAGVPQGSILGPLLWIIYYDSILKTPMPHGVTLLGYADDTAIVVKAKTEDLLTVNTNIALGRLQRAINKKQLQVEKTKTEAVILYGARSLKSLRFEIDDVIIETRNSLKYLGVHFGKDGNMMEHVKQTITKCEKTTMALSRLMPNIGGPTSSRRKILATVCHSVILYAAPIWGGVLRYQKYRNMLISMQRKMAIRVASAYRTISAEAIQVIAGLTPIDLLVEERMKTYGMEKADILQAREQTMREWQNRWGEETGKAKWTKTLIRDLEKWTNRKHGDVDYHLTQFLGGHGCFCSFLKRFRLRQSDECWYCGMVDTPEHTFFQCQRWTEQRNKINTIIGAEMTPNNIIELMLKGPKEWEEIHESIRIVLGQKEKDELENKEPVRDLRTTEQPEGNHATQNR